MSTGNDKSGSHQGVTPSSANNGQRVPPESLMLDLALSWNRADIARTDILTDDVILDSRGYMETFLNALKQVCDILLLMKKCNLHYGNLFLLNHHHPLCSKSVHTTVHLPLFLVPSRCSPHAGVSRFLYPSLFSKIVNI